MAQNFHRTDLLSENLRQSGEGCQWRGSGQVTVNGNSPREFIASLFFWVHQFSDGPDQREVYVFYTWENRADTVANANGAHHAGNRSGNVVVTLIT